MEGIAFLNRKGDCGKLRKTSPATPSTRNVELAASPQRELRDSRTGPATPLDNA